VKPSLKRRLLLLALGATALVWLVTVLFTWLDARHEIREVLDAHLAQSASLLLVQLSHDLDEIETEHAPLLHKDARKVAFQIWEEGVRLGLHSVNAPQEPLGTRDQGFSERTVEGSRWRVFTSWDASGEYLIHVGERMELREELAAEMAQGLLLPLLVALPVLGILLWIAVGRGLRPLASLTDEVAQRDPDNLAPLDAARTPRDVLPLVEQLNRLFARIAQSFERERRFTADAAHELRTPVAAIKAQAQVAQLASGLPARDHALDQVVAGAERASRLVEQLLTLARLDAIDRNALEPCGLRALAAQAVAEAAPAALSHGVCLELVASGDVPDVQVRCIPALVEVLIRNLIDNAVRHGGGGAVRVEVADPTGCAVVSVTDEGPGIPEHERSKVLERFYRLPEAGEGGSGLGLSIVQRIAQIHDAELVMRSGPAMDSGEGGKGLRVEVRFPLAGPQSV
jgi:two-component system sensor histidine kinase QseC